MAEFSVSLLLKVVKEQFVQGLREGVAQGVQQLNLLQQTAQTTAKTTNEALGSTGAASVRRLGDEAAKARPALEEMGRAAGVAGNGAANAADAARGKIAQMRAESAAVGPALAGVVPGAAALKNAIAGAFSIAAVTAFTREILDATLAHQKLINTLQFVAGSAKGAADQYDFVRATANKLGLELNVTGNAYTKLAAASKGTSLEGEQTRRIFTSVAQAATVLGLSSSELEGALLAVSQMISKGTVQAEELRGQLGERLPGAFQLAARSIGVTEGQLGKLLDTGSLTADRLLPALAAELERTFGASSAAAAQSLNAQINRLKNSFQELLLSISSAGGESAIATVVGQLAQGLTALKGAIDSLSKADLSRLGRDFSGVYETVKDLVTQLVQLGTDVLGAIKTSLDYVVGAWSRVAGSTRDAADQATALQRVFQGLQITVAAISDVIKGVTIAFNLAAGAIFVAIEKIFGGVATLVSKVSAEMAAPLRDIANAAGDAAAKSFLAAEKATESFKSSTIATLDALTTETKKTADGLRVVNENMGDALAPLVKPLGDLSGLFKQLGVDINQVAGNISTKFIESIKVLAELGNTGRATSAQLLDAFKQLAEGAKTGEEIKVLAGILEGFRQTAKLTGEDGAKAFDFITAAVNRTAGQILGPLAAAFERLGIETKTALKGAADQALSDFKLVESSGLATAGGIRDAFLKVLEAVAQANNGVIPPTLQAKAALLGLEEEAQRIADKYDLVGAKAKKAGDDQVNAANKATEAVKETKDAIVAASEETSKRGQQVASDFYGAVNGMMAAVRELGGNAADIFQQKTGLFVGFTDSVKAARAALQGAREDLAALKRPIGDVIGITDYFYKLEKGYLETKIQVLAAKDAAEQLAAQQKRIAEEADKAAKAQQAAAAAAAAASAEQSRQAEITRAANEETARRSAELATQFATGVRTTFDGIADAATFGIGQIGDLAKNLDRAKQSADPLADAMRSIAVEAARAAKAFAGTAVSIREELLQLEGREAEGAALRFQQRRAELDLEFRIQEARLRFALTQATSSDEQLALLKSLSDLRSNFDQATKDLNRIQEITLQKIADEAKKREEQRLAEEKAKLQQLVDEGNRQRQQQIDLSLRERQQTQQTIQHETGLRLQSISEEEAARLAAQQRDFLATRQAIQEEKVLRLQALDSTKASELANRAILNAAAGISFAGITNAASRPGAGAAPVTNIQQNTFHLDATNLLSETAIRRNVVPVLDEINRRKT